MTWRTVGVVVACVTAMGCGPDPSPGPMQDGGAVAQDTSACTPNTTLPCACLGGRLGMQYCTVFGQLDACTCPQARECSNRRCGPDGVGGLCGVCPAGQTCSNAGQCLCTPNCAGRACGADGCGGSCGSCGTGFQCGGAGICDVDPSSRWVLTVTNGTVATTGSGGGAWDPFGGAPDPQVCITISGRQTCTPYASDTFTATWNFAFPVTTAGVLQAGVMASFLDYDTGTANDRICGDYLLAIDRATFSAGGTSVGCGVSGWSFTLRAQ